MADGAGGGSVGAARGMETIGYLFTAKDLASGVAVKAEKAIEAAASGVENTLIGLTTATDNITAQIGVSFDGVEAGVAQMQATAEAVLVDLATTFDEAPPLVSRQFWNVPDALKEALAQLPLKEQAEAVRTFYEAMNGLPAVAEVVGVHFDKLNGKIDKNLVTFKNIKKWVGQGIKDSLFGVLGASAGMAVAPIGKLAVGIGNAADRFQAFIQSDKKLKTIGNLFFDLKTKAGSAAVAIKDGVRAFFGFSDPKGMRGFKDFEHGLGGLRRGGGIGGALLGPLAPVLRLLQPLLDLVEEALQPAIETFGALVRNAFAPFSFLADTIAL